MNKFFTDLESVGGKIEAEMIKLVGEADAEIVKCEPIAAAVLAGAQPYVDVLISATLGACDVKLADSIMTAVRSKLQAAYNAALTEGLTPTVVSTVSNISAGLPGILSFLGIKSASATAAAGKVVEKLSSVVTAAAAIVPAAQAAVAAAEKQTLSTQESAAVGIQGITS